MSVDPITLLTLFLMAAGTYLTRISGILLVEKLAFTGRTRAALEAVAPGVLTAMIAPAVLAGWAEVAAALVTVAIARTGAGMVIAVAAGVAVVAGMRAYGV
ncbi:MAG: AzlD domain-containing protein [Alphaproteobacteria bacterium]|nr:AzlD domain-containing protein [Alphaproteobacteria bacterium]